MQITFELPDEIAQQLAAGQDLPRAALEALVVEGCRTHRLSDHQAAQLLGLDGRLAFAAEFGLPLLPKPLTHS